MKKFFEKIIFSFIAFTISTAVNSQTKILSILADDSSVFVGTNYGIYFNQNNGFDWKLSNNGLPDGVDISKLVKFKSVIFATDQTNGLFISRDKGAFWKKVDAFPRDFIKVNYLFANDTSLFVVDADKGIIYTSDEGKTWNPINLLKWLDSKNPVYTDEKSDLKNRVKKETTQMEEKVVSDKTVSALITCESIILAAVSSRSTGNGLYKSTDNGQTWIEASFDLQDVKIKQFYAYGNKIYAVTSGFSGAVYRSENYGANWTKLSKSQLRWVTSFCANSNTLFLGNYYDGICTSTDNGLTWKKIDGLELKKQQTVDHLEATNEGLYVGTSDGIILFTNENGDWKIKNEGLNTKQTGAFSYTTIGTQNGITLGANKLADEIIFEVQNTTAVTAKVHIKVSFECEYTSDLGMITLPKQEIDWLITVDANSVKSYDTNPEACAIGSCKNSTKSWEVVSWVVY